MKIKQSIALILVVLLGGGLCLWAFQFFRPAQTSADDPHREHEHDAEHAGHGHTEEEHHEESAPGPHGGRWLTDGHFRLELSVYEEGTPPRFRAYAFDEEKPIDPDAVQLTVQLDRLGAETETVQFHEESGFLQSDQIIAEPHSFRVKVIATHDGARHEWEYDSFEGRTELSDAAVRESGIEIETVEPREITEAITTYGRIAPNEDQLAYVIPRFPGRVLEIHKRLGDPVEQGEVLARIESNESLQPYDVVSPLAGTVIDKNVSPGEFARPEQAIYTVANLEKVWVDLNVYPRDFPLIELGQDVRVSLGENLPAHHGRISYISPFGSENSQTMLARVVLTNEGGLLRPGLFVSARIVVDRKTVPMAVRASALQTFRDWQVVFIRMGNIFEARPVTPGRRDSEWVEIVAGLEPGQAYAAKNSFIIKADILKSGAAHHH